MTKMKGINYDELLRGETVDFEKVGKVTAESVRKHTGKNWKQWVGVLDKAGAGTWTYQEIVAFLKTKHKLTPWWQQGVALGFEIATGRRKTGQDAKGKYMVTATKSFSFGVQEVWKTLISKKGQAIWLKPYAQIKIAPKAQFETEDGFFGEIRTITKARRMRLFWQDPLWEKHTVVEVMLVSRPAKKSILVFNHTGLADLRAKDQMKVRWRNAADELAKTLSGD